MTITNNVLKQTVIDRFEKEFHTTPEALILAPGRVNLIGEYTDFNNGFVLPMAIDRYLAMTVRKREDDIIKVNSVDFNETVTLNLHSLKKESHSFQEYISGCIWALKEKDYTVSGFECVIAGNIPVGAGLSSSAALELAVLKAASFSSGFPFDKVRMAIIGQYAENNWVDVNCGIMDQVISSAGKSGHALLIDCSNLSLKECPLPPETSVIILDTDTRRGLVDSAYNERRDQCFKAAEIMGVQFLRDADETMLAEAELRMNEQEYKRAKHIISENARVLTAAESMKQGDAEAMGRLMNESHESLRDDFEVTSPALNAIVECSGNQDSCIGARMTGAGFGGCAVALVKKDQEDTFIQKVTSCYQNKTGLSPRIYKCKPSEGVTLKEL